MAVYSRPARYEEVPFPPPANFKAAFVRNHRVRNVSKPLGRDVCPNEIFLGWSKITAMGTSASLATTQDARQGILGSRVDPLSGNYGRAFNSGLNLITQANNKCYDAFKEKIFGNSAELGVNLAERRQAVTMITDRASTLVHSFLALKKGNLRKFFRSLNVKPLPKHQRWTYARNASAFWLEYHFGWSPLLDDIYSACDILQSGYGKPRSIRARASANDYVGRWVNFGYNQDLRNVFLIARTQLGADMTVINPNFHQAARLGLINPASVAWELIPFSFLVDWFIPVGNFLNSWTDFVGLSFSNPYTTNRLTVSGSVDYQWRYGSGQFGISNDLEAFSVKRMRGLTTPVIYPKQLKGLSVTRAATAVSLLLQVFKPGS